MFTANSLDNPPVLDRHSFPVGRVIFREGDDGDCAYILQDGAIDIVRDTAEGKVTLGRLKPGSIFGEMALIDNAPRMAMAIAAEPSTVIVIRAEMLKRKLERADPFIAKLLGFLVQKVRTITDAHIEGKPLTHWFEGDSLELHFEAEDPAKGLAQGPFIKREKKAG